MSVESARARLAQASDLPWRRSRDGLRIEDRNGVSRVEADWAAEGDMDLIVHAPTDLAAALAVIKATDRQTVAYSRLAQAQRLGEAERITAAEDEATEAETAYWAARRAFEALP